MLHKDSGPTTDRLFGAHEAARFLGVHRSTLHMAVRQGVIVPDARTPGGHMRFSRQTLEAFRGQLAEGAATAGSVYAPVHALADLARLVAERAEFARICAAVVEGLRAALPGVDMCAIAVRAGDPRDPVRLRLVAQQGFPAWLFEDYARLRKIFKFSTTTVLLSGEMEVCEDVSQQPVYSGVARIQQPLRLGSYAVVPIGGGGRHEAMGVIVCSCHRPRAFSEHDRAFLRGVADQLAVALTSSVQQERASANLDAACELIAMALALSGNGQDEGESVTSSEQAHAVLRNAFLQLSGAERVCALGFGAEADLQTTDPHLLNLACAACAGDEPVQEQWREGGALRTGIGASVAVGQGRRAGVAAVWLGERSCPGAEQALLVAFAGACVLAVG